MRRNLFNLKFQVIDLQQKLGIRVSGASPPKPVSSFAHFGFDEALMKAIRKSEFSQPTPIQVSSMFFHSFKVRLHAGF